MHSRPDRYGSRLSAAPRVLQLRASSSRDVTARFVEDWLSSPGTTSEEAPFAVSATTCDDAPFVVRASLPVNSPKSLLSCGHSNRPRVPPGVLWSSAHLFVPPGLARSGRLIGIRARHRRDRNVAIGRISYGTTQTCVSRRRGLALRSTWTLVRWRLGNRQRGKIAFRGRR